MLCWFAFCPGFRIRFLGILRLLLKTRKKIVSWLYVGLKFGSISVRFLPWVSDAFSWILGLVGKIKFSIAAGHMESAIGLLSVQRRAN